MNQVDEIKKKVEDAYSVVKDAKIPDEGGFKIEGFKLVLSSLLSSKVIVAQHNPLNTGERIPAKIDTFDITEWQSTISASLGISKEDVTKLYYLDGENSLRLILDMKSLSKSLALATKHIAMLLAAGRQAAKFDLSGTSFEVIRRECDQYGAVDKKNFTTHLKQLKPKFQPEGKGLDQSLRVTPPGFGAAGKLAKDYLEQTQE